MIVVREHHDAAAHSGATCTCADLVVHVDKTNVQPACCDILRMLRRDERTLDQRNSGMEQHDQQHRDAAKPFDVAAVVQFSVEAMRILREASGRTLGRVRPRYMPCCSQQVVPNLPDVLTVGANVSDGQPQGVLLVEPGV